MPVHPDNDEEYQLLDKIHTTGVHLQYALMGWDWGCNNRLSKEHRDKAIDDYRSEIRALYQNWLNAWKK